MPGDQQTSSALNMKHRFGLLTKKRLENVQISYNASGGGFAQPSECRHMGGWPNCHVTFIVAKKLKFQFILLYLLLGIRYSFICQGTLTRSSEMTFSELESSCRLLLPM